MMGLALKMRPAFAGVDLADRFARQREAKFGMFIHWGPYSVAGVEASWPIMIKNDEITEAEYRSLPARFNPGSFDPEEWIDLARRAGQRYMVFTTKHCDGFCMFDSEYTDYKITRTPYGKDVFKQLADACASRRMALGIYYSPPDLNHPGYRDTTKPSTTNYRGEPQRPEWPLYLDYMGLQLHELLTRYGPIAEVWFDTCDPNAQARFDGQRFVDEVRRLQPEALINNRMGVPGDFLTPEQFIPRAVPTKGVRMDSPDHSEADKQPIVVPRQDQFQPWETCMTINDTWAYRPKDRNFKSADTLIRSLVEVVSRGGNFLLDVGPQPDGRIQPEFVERLEAVGKWVHLNAKAIYGTTYGPVQGADAFRTSARQSTVYVFVMDPSATAIEIEGLKGKIGALRHLATGRPLRFAQAGGRITIGVGHELWASGLPVLELNS
ncbi:MAG: alpha-L-fucosidase [Terracidiphilus sp.]|jgi:alpha-L-fucosidase